MIIKLRSGSKLPLSFLTLEIIMLPMQPWLNGSFRFPIYTKAKTYRLADLPGLDLRMDLEFPDIWGLVLLYPSSCISKWQAVDPYQLLWDSFGGSAYDIACAIADGPILYRLANGTPHSQPTQFKPPFLDQLYLVIFR
ncbi:hypothetical protein D5R40_33120 [Okeania hirsuta]|uniref:Uncharacterized protein n=1 Tax=Okeania hirsuta TaxID=1458930 RepID=A0A3N6P5M2_9CYAN|nr:hypothetical protein [Okeania hirsuta]RQH17898.1 hypothetical protein D5R40_33120 [Okeania hirsuta]